MLRLGAMGVLADYIYRNRDWYGMGKSYDRYVVVDTNFRGLDGKKGVAVLESISV